MTYRFLIILSIYIKIIKKFSLSFFQYHLFYLLKYFNNVYVRFVSVHVCMYICNKEEEKRGHLEKKINLSGKY